MPPRDEEIKTMPDGILSKTITINGITCEITGKTEEELAADEAEARACYDKFGGDISKIATYQNIRVEQENLRNSIGKIIGSLDSSKED